jgi:hypothetical protein
MLVNIYQTIRRHILEGSTPDLCIEVDVRGSMTPQLKIKFNVRHNLKKTLIKCTHVKRSVMYQTQNGNRSVIELCRVLRILHQNTPFQLKKIIYRRNQMKITGKLRL